LLRLDVLDEEDFFRQAFCKHPDGSWTCTEAATLYTPFGRIEVGPGRRFYHGDEFMGFDVARWLEVRMGDMVAGCDET
jgi:hypothetical protein